MLCLHQDIANVQWAKSLGSSLKIKLKWPMRLQDILEHFRINTMSWSVMCWSFPIHYCEFMSDGISIGYSIVSSGAEQRKYQSSVLLSYVRGIHWSPVSSPHKGPVMWKMIPFDDVNILRNIVVSCSLRHSQALYKQWVTSLWSYWLYSVMACATCPPSHYILIGSIELHSTSQTVVLYDQLAPKYSKYTTRISLTGIWYCTNPW